MTSGGNNFNHPPPQMATERHYQVVERHTQVAERRSG